jgi:hypothetical protein
MQQSRQSRNPKAAALFGGLLFLPFVAANAIIANRIEPFFSFIRPGLNTSPFEYGLLAVVLGLMPVGAFIAARPLFDKSTYPRGRDYLVNGGIAVLMLVVFVTLTVALGDEIYRCDVLRIPNCD